MIATANKRLKNATPAVISRIVITVFIEFDGLKFDPNLHPMHLAGHVRLTAHPSPNKITSPSQRREIQPVDCPQRKSTPDRAALGAPFLCHRMKRDGACRGCSQIRRPARFGPTHPHPVVIGCHAPYSCTPNNKMRQSFL